jgi:phospholipid/cholesterol/gamma-HCH transport system permease protein
MVIALQTGYQLKKFGIEDTIGSIVGLAMVREMGPVITAFLVSGRVGSAMGAELATMAVTEELDALRVMGIKPVRYLVVPRFVACMLMLPVLTIYSIVIRLRLPRKKVTTCFARRTASRVRVVARGRP